MSLGKYMRNTKPKDEPEFTTDTTKCFASQCPLPGVTGAIGQRLSYCCVHDGEQPHQWPLQTERIKEHNDLWTVCFEMLNVPAGTRLSRSLAERLMQDGAPLPNKGGREFITVREYGHQLHRWLCDTCRGPKLERKLSGTLANEHETVGDLY